MQKVKKNHSFLKRTAMMFMAVILLITSFLSFGSLSAFASDGDILDVDVTVKQLYELGVGTNDFALYVLVDNPKDKDLDLSEERNKIQIGYSVYEKDVFSTEYNKYELDYKQETDAGYLLFQVLNIPAPKSLVRYYAVSGIELVTVGDANATEYGVSKVYRCETKENVNTITVEPLDTIEVDVNHTFYRSVFSNKNENNILEMSFDNWSEQLSSCYFSLPKNFGFAGKTGGKLESLTAEFYNFVTKPILITNNQAVYNEYSKYLHRKCDDKNLAFQGDVAIHETGTSETLRYNYDYMFSFVEFSRSNYMGSTYNFRKCFDILDWLFIDTDADFLSEDYLFSSEKLKSAFNSYASLNSRDVAISDLFISEDEYYEDEYNLSDFSYGYNKHTYSISKDVNSNGDVFGFNFQVAQRPNFWSWFTGVLPENTEVLPIEVVNVAHAKSLSDEEFSKRYFVDKSTVFDLKQYVISQNLINKEVYLFRYDACEYFGGLAVPSPFARSLGENNSMFLAQESVYLDFDILSFGFNQDGERYVIANVMSPEDEFPPISPSPEPEPVGCALFGWIKSILGIIVFVVAVIVAGIIVFFIFKFIFAVCATQWKTWVKVFWIIVVLLAIGAMLFFAVPWVINLITSLRG